MESQGTVSTENETENTKKMSKYQRKIQSPPSQTMNETVQPTTKQYVVVSLNSYPIWIKSSTSYINRSMKLLSYGQQKKCTPYWPILTSSFNGKRGHFQDRISKKIKLVLRIQHLHVYVDLMSQYLLHHAWWLHCMASNILQERY